MANALSSDKLEDQFGPTEVEVLYQDLETRLRIIRTVVKDSRQILELSRVALLDPGIAEFPEIHHEIVNGKSMGKAFRDKGVIFERLPPRVTVSHVLPDSFNRQFGSSGPATVVDVAVLVGPARTPYAEILETYSPEVEWGETDGELAEEQLAKILLLDEFLRKGEA